VGQNVGIAAVLEMYLQRGIGPRELLHGKPEEMEVFDWARLISKGPVVAMGLSKNQVRDKASTRGTTVHTAFERWATGNGYPDPLDFPEHEQGYVIALVTFLHDVPTLEPLGIEMPSARRSTRRSLASAADAGPPES
jgi:hypothetical protein